MRIKVKGGLGEIEVDVDIPQNENISYSSLGCDEKLRRWSEMQTKMFSEIRETYKTLEGWEK